MLSRFRGRISSAHVLALIALFVALGGSAYALKKNSVKSKNIKDETIQSKDIKDGGVASSDVLAATLGSGDLADGSVSGPKIAAKVISSSKLGTITERSEAVAIEDDASPFERNEVDCNDGEQAISGSVAPIITDDEDELLVAESNYDPAGGAPPNDTGWIFGLGNLDDATGYGDADNSAIAVTEEVLCLEA